MNEPITAENLQQLRSAGMFHIADEIERLQTCERKLSAMARWIERAHPSDFRSGLWEALEVPII